ncbi:MAG TPA: cyclic nucleotide-binding domain-containing protein [Rhodobacteraceae bacterium]|nr:cyclic nucleotide-binding domain-containing protein [Paracoccaceae bacterium]
MPNNRFEEIRALPLFTSCSEASFEALTRGAYVQNFPPQIELISEGDTADFLYIIVSGVVELLSTWSGRETSMAFLKPYDTFILAATIKDGPYLMSARTLEKSRLILIPSEDVRAVFERDSDFAKAIVRELAICYRASIRNTKNLKLRTSVERLANYIVKHDRRHGDGGSFALPVEKRKLASRLGMTPENLSRSFAALKNHGVEVSGSMIQINDPEKLLAYAKPDPLIDS